jgi:hypothetical protein
MKKMRHEVTGFAIVCLFSAGLITSMSYAQIDMDNVVAIWLFDEGQGDVAKDLSPNGNDASFNGAPKWVPGKFGDALYFDGADDYLAAEDSDTLDVVGEEITLMAWVNADGWPADWNHVIRKTTPDSATPYFYILGVHATALAFIHLQTDAGDFYDLQGATALPTKEWIHLTMTYDGEEIKIYVNGEVDGSFPANGAIQPNEGELRIGRGNPAGYFTGTIDDVAIFKVALSEDEVRSIMNKGLASAMSVEPQGKLAETWGNIKAR